MINLKSDKRGSIGPCSYFAFFGLLCYFLFSLSTPVHSGTIELPQTGQTTCYNATGAEIACVGTGQDGDFLAGVAWTAERFSTYSFDCMIDNLTGLTWARYPYPFIPTNWDQALVNVASLSLCGCFPWIIPNINQLQSLLNADWPDNRDWLESNDFILNLALDRYWSSTIFAGNIDSAWVVSMIDGSISPADRLNNNYGVWPVCVLPNPPPPADNPPGEIWRTGQTISYRTNDDGALKLGAAWPNPRFTESGDCVTDNLTGLVWSGDGNLDGLKTWANALTYTDDLTVCGYADWRLPNSKELFSLVDRSQSEPALPVGYPFTNVQFGLGDLYWSSTTYADLPTSPSAWTLDMLRGSLIPILKTQNAFVWPVRGGQTRPYILEVEKLGNGQGKVAAPGLTCVGKICTGDYSSYEVVTVTATANPGSVFTGWGGDACSGITESTCAITMTDDTTVTATFLTELKISVDPKSVNFKNLKQNIPPSGQIVTVTNVGAAPLNIIAITITGDDASVFTFTDNCLSTDLPSNTSCTITVTATSDNFDTRKAQLQISSTDPKKPIFNVKLKAKAKPPKIAKKPGRLNFGKATLPGSSEKTLSITNKGITDLIIGTITITGDNPGDFSIVLPDTCSGSTLATSESCVLTVRFAPSAAEKRSALLNIPSNDPKKQPAMTVKLKGKGE